MGGPQYWVIEDADGTQHILCDDPAPQTVESDDGPEVIDRYPDAVRRGPIPTPIDLAAQRWDFDLGEAVSKWTPQEARDRRWGDAKEYHLLVTNGGFPLPGIGWVQTDAESREAIRTLADEARDELEAGNDEWSTSFKNLDNERVPVTAQQVLDVYRATRAFLGLCFQAKEAVQDVLDAALVSGASAADILAIDITTGYPA